MELNGRPDQIWKRRKLDGREIIMRIVAVGAACLGSALVIVSMTAVVGMFGMMMTEGFLFVIGVLIFLGITFILVAGTISIVVSLWRDEL